MKDTLLQPLSNQVFYMLKWYGGKTKAELKERCKLTEDDWWRIRKFLGDRIHYSCNKWWMTEPQETTTQP